MFSTITAQPGLQMRNKTWGAGPSFDTALATGLATAFVTGFAAGFTTRRTVFRARVVRRTVRREVLVAVIRLLSVTRRVGFIFSISKAYAVR
jgi:hypothetical protein